MPPTPKKPPGGGNGGPTQYRFVGDHATVLESGQPLAPGEYVTLAPADLVGHNQMLLDDGNLIDASGYVPAAQLEQEDHAEVEASEAKPDPNAPQIETKESEK